MTVRAKLDHIVTPSELERMDEEDFFEEMLAWKEGRLVGSDLDESEWQDMWDRMAGAKFGHWLMLKTRQEVGLNRR